MLSQKFFDDYAEGYYNNSSTAVAEHFFVPSVIMSNETKNVFTSIEAVAKQIQEFMNKLVSLGVAQFEPEVCQTMKLSENILFSNVKWVYKDETGQEILHCFVSYTLQSENDSLKIIVSVIDDQQRELAKLL